MKISNYETNEIDYSADTIWVGFTKVDEELLDKYPNVKVVASRTTGLDHIDQGLLKDRGIELISLRGSDLSDVTATAEWTFFNMGMLLRKTGHELRGKNLLIIGVGRIGKLLSKYSNSFGMTVRGADRGSEMALLGVLKWADIVSLNITADEENRNFMNREKFEAMKQGSWFVNSARDWLVDPEALKWALENRLAGAWSDFPEHQAGQTIEAKEKTTKILMDKLCAK